MSSTWVNVGAIGTCDSGLMFGLSEPTDADGVIRGERGANSVLVEKVAVPLRGEPWALRGDLPGDFWVAN